VIDVSEKCISNRDYQVSIDDFTQWEAKNGIIPENSIILLFTDYGKYYPDKIKYIGTAKRGAEALPYLHFPGLSPEAAQWLADNRNINMIGLDTPSIDYGQSSVFETHQILLKNDILIIENVANMDKLPLIGTTIFAFPMKIKGGSGAPLRLVGLVP
jgi:kynurenine formamidase